MLAAVDLGSNRFRLRIGYHDSETIRIVRSACGTVCLGGGLDVDGNFIPGKKPAD